MSTTVKEGLDNVSIQSEQSENLSKYMHKLANITKLCVLEKQMGKAKNYLAYVERMYNQGDIRTKNIITNIYVFSVSSFLEIRSYNMREVFPKCLCDEYYKQVNASTL
jgi:hypothetical protein